MNSTERLTAAMTGKPADRRAILPVLSLYGAKLTDCPLDIYYTNAAAYVRGQAAVSELFEPDVLFGPFCFAAFGAAFGSKLRFYKDHPPMVSKPAIESLEQWDTLNWPDIDTHPVLLYFRNAIRQMVSDVRGQMPIVIPLPPPTDLLPLIMGMELWMDTVLFNPNARRRIMDKIIPFFVRLANGLLSDGAAFIAMPCVFASPAVVSRSIVSEFTRPALMEAFSQLKGPVVLHHGGEPILRHLDLLTGLPSVAVFVLDENDNIEQARAVIGPDVVICAGPGAARISSLTSEQIHQECCAMLESCRHDSRFILCNSGPDIPMNTPPHNIQALCRAAEMFAGCGV